mmetsp:Transcript_10630/g.10282  ORF Transcript_10630/g.10282 Transcript_10630/m.10282 type:complete len:88 (+) Transcript_10630:670-933(+)
MLFDGERASGLQDGGTSAGVALVFLLTDVAKDDCIEAAAKAAAADGCCDGCFVKKVSLEPDRVEGEEGVALLFEPLDKVIVDYRLFS